MVSVGFAVLAFLHTVLMGRWGKALPRAGIMASHRVGNGDLPGERVRQPRPDPEPRLQPPAPQPGKKALEQRFPAVMGTLPGQPASCWLRDALSGEGREQPALPHLGKHGVELLPRAVVPSLR